MAIAETVRSFLTAKGTAFELVAHPHTFSTHDSAGAAHVAADHLAKAVVIKDERGFAMAVIAGDSWLKAEALRNKTGRSFELAPEAEVDALFEDCEPGAIPPLGPAYGLDTFIDERLMTLAHVYFEAGDHEHLVHVDGAALRRLLEGAHPGYFSHDG